MSLIVAVYDPPIDVLRTQLESIAQQTCDDWECIVVDDASRSAEVRELLDAWCGLSQRRRLIRRSTNGGIAAATNDGLDAAHGEFVAICDHDDVVHPTAVEALIDHFREHPRHDVVYTDERVIDGDGAERAPYCKPDYSPIRHLGHHYLAHLVAARRSAVGNLRVDPRFEPAQDYDFYLRVIERAEAAGRTVGHIPEMLYSWRAIEGSSALDASEKPEMAAAVKRCVDAAIDRRNLDLVASTVTHDGAATTSVRLTLPPADLDAVHIPIDDSTSPSDVNALIESSDQPVICLVPTSADGLDWVDPLIRRVAHADCAAAGPFITGRSDAGDAVVLSVGRTVSPRLADPFHGVDAGGPGPFGSFFVAREASALAPVGLTVTRAAVVAAGGFATDVGLDVAVAELCARIRADGQACVVDPSIPLGLDRSDPLLDNAGDRQRADDLAIAERRCADVAIERLATTGILPPVDVAPNAYEQARRAIVSGACELVTSDVFDTIVTRTVTTPSDLFVELGSVLHADGTLAQHVSPTVFAEGRRSAERRARQAVADAASLRPDDPAHTAPECTLDEVWDLVPNNWNIDPAEGMAAELALEATRLIPIPPALDLFDLAHTHGVEVVLVSDIYLSSTQLSDLLGAAGVDMTLIDEVVTSADHRRGKAQGLLAQVIADRSATPSSVIHLGDNEVADVETARRIGAVPIHVDIHSGHRHVESSRPPLAAWSTDTGTDLGISATCRSVLVHAGLLGQDPSFQFGAAVVGPALAGFSKWIHDQAAQLGATHVHCMLREGATIGELMAITAPDGATPVPLHVSRWVTMRAAVIDGTADELRTALARRADLTPAHVAEAFDVDIDAVRAALGGDRVPPSELAEACEALAADDAVRHAIVAASTRLRTRVLTHLHRTLVVDDGPIVVCDVGWGGTIQEGLERILRSDGVTNPLVGLYFALSGAGEERTRLGADMRAYLPTLFENRSAARHSTAVAHHADSIERVLTPKLGTLIDIADDGTPITRSADHDPVPPTLAAAQRAMRTTVERLSADDNECSDITDPRWTSPELRAAFAQSIAAAITTPSIGLARALGSWPHDDVAGTDHRSIASAQLGAATAYANVVDLDLVDPAGRQWIPGVAAEHNPTLQAHLAAAHAGVPLDALAPESRNGMARLAAFETGSDLAAVQVGRRPGVAPHGWSMLRIDGPIESLRSIRFDAGEHASIVEVAALRIELRTDLILDPAPIVIDDLRRTDVVWVGAHPLDRRHFAQQAGGHLLVDIDEAVGEHVRGVEVTAAFRSWLLEPGDTLANTPVVQRLDAQRRRVTKSVRRRLQRD